MLSSVESDKDVVWNSMTSVSCWWYLENRTVGQTVNHHQPAAPTARNLSAISFKADVLTSCIESDATIAAVSAPTSLFMHTSRPANASTETKRGPGWTDIAYAANGSLRRPKEEHRLCLFLNCFFSWWENDVVACRLLSTNVMSISVIYETVWLLIKECGFGYTHTPIQETPTPRTKTFSVWANVCFVLFIADRPADFDRPFWIFTRNEGYNWGTVYISSPSSGGHLSTSLAKRDKSLTLLRLLDK